MAYPPAPQPVRATLGDTRADPTVFLSYAHAEQAVARELWQALASNGLNVLIDEELLKPGDDIAGFARRMIKQADATVCLVSSISLASAWVVFEAATALEREYDNPAARLIACATDRAFFEDGFHLGIGGTIDQRLAAIKQALTEQIEKELGIDELVQERSRLLRMRESLGAILAKLRNSLTLILEPNGIAESARRVADHIRYLKGQQPSRSDPRDIRARAQALRNFLVIEETESALGQLLQFVQEFSTDRKHLRHAISCCNTLRRIARLEQEENLGFGDAEERREPTIIKVLELIDEIEADPQLPLAS